MTTGPLDINKPSSRYRVQHRLRVRWSEVDMQKVVFNPHYLTYFDIAAAQYWRDTALPYEETLKFLNGDIFVKKASLEYNGSAYFDESLTICLRCERIGNSSMLFKGSILRNSLELVAGEIVYVFADPVQRISKPIPSELKALITRFEAGEEITHLRIGAWSELRDDALGLRQDVFVREQGVPLDMEEDEFDSQCVHFVLFNALNLPIATARLIEPKDTSSKGQSRVGRMAVRKDLRGSHWGKRVLAAVEEFARKRGDTTLSLHAQLQAKEFYSKQGYVPVGETFEEAGIEHIEMQKML